VVALCELPSVRIPEIVVALCELPSVRIPEIVVVLCELPSVLQDKEEGAGIVQDLFGLFILSPY
jgi:hypothetical protein